MKFIIFTSAVVLVLTTCNALPSSMWVSFKLKYGKTYSSLEEEVVRKTIWEKSLLYIEKHNMEAAEGKHTYTLAENKYSDLTHQEFKQLMNGYRRKEGALTRAKPISSSTVTDSLPTTVDWRDQGIVTPVKDQGACGSCWAFSSTGSIEGQWALYSSNLVSLSEQNLVDCAGTEYNNEGCGGGYMFEAMAYVVDNNGIDTETSYPYTAIQGSCKYSSSNKGATISSYVEIPSGSVSDLQKAVADVGPISIAFDASDPSFQMYSSGIYDPPACSTYDLDHGVLAIGYGTSDGTDYWLVKNSWGVDWGMEGYFMIIRTDDNKCGVATEPVYPVV